MKSNVNELLNYFLYSSIKENEDDKYVLNIFNTLNTLFSKNEINDNFLIEKMNSSKAIINTNYDWNDEKYYNEFFKKYNLLNYYGSSLSDNILWK